MAETIKAIIFDLNSTLVKSGDPEQRIIEEFNLDIYKEKVELVFCGKARNGSVKEFSGNLIKKLGIPASKANLQKMQGIIEKELKIVEPYPDAIPVLKALNARGFKLGLVSNSWGLAVEKLKKTSKIFDLFDAISFSHKTGKFKPNPASFKNCTRALGIKPFHAVMIGNSFKSDIVGAARVKMKSILLNRSRIPVEGLGPVPQIFGLKETGKAIEAAAKANLLQVGQPKVRKPNFRKKEPVSKQRQVRRRRRF